MDSITGIKWAFSVKRQAAYATANPNGDIAKANTFDGADIADHVPNMSDNSASLGKGHEFATRVNIMSWDVRFRRACPASTLMLAWAFGFHTGACVTTSLGGSPAAYKHVFEYQDVFGVGYYGAGRQLPVTTVIEQATSGLVRGFPSLSVMAIEITGTLNNWVMMAVELIGSGKKTDASGFVFPASNEGNLLRMAGLTFSHGVSGSPADISCDIRSFRFRTENAYAEDDGYCPGSGYQGATPATGQIRNRLEVTRRASIFEFVVRSSASTTLQTRLEASTELWARLTITGDLISGANSHALILDIPRFKYRAVPIQADGDMITFNVSTFLIWDPPAPGFGNPWQSTVITDVTGFLVSS